MKNQKCVLLFVILSCFINVAFSQLDGNECGTKCNTENLQLGITDGVYKPVRSDKSGGVVYEEPNNMYFPILIVCVQFHNETDDNINWDWHPEAPPNYINNLIANQKEFNGNWWDKYNGKLVSDWWQETSCGKMHVIGSAIPITLDYTGLEYINNYPNLINRQRAINEEIWLKVSAIQGFTWQFYDKWKKENGLWVFGDGDDYIDMIYKVHRTNPSYNINGNTVYVLPHFEGYGYLSADEIGWGDNYTYNIPSSTKKIFYNFSDLGSGLTCQGHNATHYCMNKSPFIDLMGHEHGHFLFGSSNHIKHAKMNKNTSRDFFFSPWERTKFGYQSPLEIVYNNDNHTYTINDFSARDLSNPTLLQLPIRDIGSGIKEYYLIANRRKISQYDVFMMGDTARRDAFRNVNENYGKGIYIYHIPRDLEYSDFNKIDLECADGLWNWEMGFPQYPDWSDNSPFPFFYPKTIDRDHNDIVLISNSSLNYVDGITSFSGLACLFSLGKKNSCTLFNQPCNEATDRYYTNNKDAWTSWAVLGDRWDAWNLNYNEIFSPYSSPSTRNWDHQQTGIFIYYKAIINNQAIIDIYKIDPGNPNSERDILAATPPSKPVGLRIEEHYISPYPPVCYPKLVWEYNIEPDMINENGEQVFEVWRAIAGNMNLVPMVNTVPALISTVSYNPALTEKPYYNDFEYQKYDCSLYDRAPYGTPFPMRYYVRAVDKDGKKSVNSDFVSTEGLLPDQGRDPGSEGDNLKLCLPYMFNIEQNYPNPFNPVTNIKYNLPKDVFVKIKIYDILGREIKILVNEFKQAGSYLVSFNGSELASGIYFYRIEAGSFTQVKRMVLVK